MSFTDCCPPLMPSHGGSYSGGSSMGLCPQNPIDDYDDLQQHHQGPPFKRPKTNHSISLSQIHSNSSLNPRFPTNDEDRRSRFDHQILPSFKKPRISEQGFHSIPSPCPQINDFGFWGTQISQFEHHDPPPFKKPRISEETQTNSNSNSNSLTYPHLTTTLNASINPPPSSPSIDVFFNTRLCTKFEVGMCRNRENFNFAHGIEDTQQFPPPPPPNRIELVEDRIPSGNWDGGLKLIHWMKRCSFLHEHPAKLGDKLGELSHSKVFRTVNNTSSDELRVNPKPEFWKTKLCKKWETRGICSLGEKCHFAHGQEGMHFCSA